MNISAAAIAVMLVEGRPFPRNIRPSAKLDKPFAPFEYVATKLDNGYYDICE